MAFGKAGLQVGRPRPRLLTGGTGNFARAAGRLAQQNCHSSLFAVESLLKEDAASVPLGESPSGTGKLPVPPQGNMPALKRGPTGWKPVPRAIALATRWAARPLFVIVSSTALLNVGIYTISDAARLTKVSPSRIRRWLRGYDFRTKKARHHSGPVWSGQLEPLEGKIAIGFCDLMEIRYVAAFLDAGVNWKTMRRAHLAAKENLQTTHPFCTHKFKTDGRNLVLAGAQNAADAQLLDIANNQQEFERIVAPFFKEIEFDVGAMRWWPLGRDRFVVLDPGRNCGQPSASRSGVPTRVLAGSVKSNGSVETVSHWFEVSAEEVRDALEFEAQLAA